MPINTWNQLQTFYLLHLSGSNEATDNTWPPAYQTILSVIEPLKKEVLCIKHLQFLNGKCHILWKLSNWNWNILIVDWFQMHCCSLERQTDIKLYFWTSLYQGNSLSNVCTVILQYHMLTDMFSVWCVLHHLLSTAHCLSTFSNL